MIHDGERLAFGFESRHDMRGVHARLDDRQRHVTANRLSLFGEPDFPHPAFAKALQKAVRPNHLNRARW
jgi:hypothetical protein